MYFGYDLMAIIPTPPIAACPASQFGKSAPSGAQRLRSEYFHTLPYFTPCIIRTVGLIRMNSATAARILNAATAPNNVGRGIELYTLAA